MLTPSHLEYFCVAERNEEDNAWKEMLNSSLSDILESGCAVSCEVQNGRVLLPESPDHRFRDNELVFVMPADSSEHSMYKDIVRGARKVRLDGVLNTGEIVLSSDIPDENVMIGISEPLLDYYEWQKNIVQKWLLDNNPAASGIICLLRSESGLEQHMPLIDDISYPDILRSALSEEITLMQGPPGCGKTYSAAEIIKHALDRGLSVGVFSFTNRAVDNLILSFAKKFPKHANCLIRSGNRPEWEKVLRPVGIGHSAKLSLPGKGLVHATTLYRLTNKADSVISEGCDHGRYDLTIIDEASQMTLPMLMPVLMCSKHTILIGDHKQLPPLIHGRPSRKDMEGLYTSAFEYLIKRKKAYFLGGTWRMRPEVADIPSRSFYNGELKSRFPLRDLNWPDMEGDRLCLEKDGLVFVEFEQETGRGKSSIVQAEYVIESIKRMEEELGDTITDIEKRLGDQSGLRYVISCFYRSQVSMIRSMLHSLANVIDISRIRVDTVERNQGQTATIGFLSVGNPLADTRPTEWILDPRRLNVAITRARLKTIVTAPRDYLDMVRAKILI